MDLGLSIFPFVLFVLNGAAWWTAYAVYRRAWMLAAAIGSFTAALTLGWLAGTPSQWPALGLGLFFWMAAPGIALVRHPRSRSRRGLLHRHVRDAGCVLPDRGALGGADPVHGPVDDRFTMKAAVS